MKFHLTLLLFLSTFIFAIGQFGHCGTWQFPDYHTTHTNHLLDNLHTISQNSEVASRGAIRYVPVRFHLIANSAGTGRVAYRNLLDEFAYLNESYAPFDIQFYFSRDTFSLINSDVLYNDPGNNPSLLIPEQNKNPNAVNIFISNSAQVSSSGGGTVLGYYSNLYDHLVIRRDQVGNRSGTIPHEMGHHFTLKHPFNGWEGDAYDPAVHGSPAPTVSPGGIPTERVNRNNCTQQADFICDTPPDYNFSNTNCAPYNGGAKDPNGELVDPMENNFMGYFFGCSSYSFTPIQQQVMNTDLSSIRRNKLRVEQYTPQQKITSTANFLSPTAGASVSPVEFKFDWDDVPNAQYYFVEMDVRLGNFSTPNYRRLITSSSDVTFRNMRSNGDLAIRVRPFNRYHTNATATTLNFRTSVSSTSENEGFLSNWKIMPNPISVGQDLNMEINFEDNEVIQFSLSDIAGKVIKVLPEQNIFQGDNSFLVPTSDLSAGLYFLTGKSGSNKIAVKKIVIQ
jgi:hypothetical protein